MWVKNIIREKQQEVTEIQVIDRNYRLEIAANYVFVGLRRAGKSYLMYQQIHQLVASGSHSIEDILFINFEDERISGILSSELGLALDAYKELYNRKPIVFLDEIQNIDGWEKFARRLADSKYRVFISGSNAQMLSKEIYTTLGGRFLIKEVSPFSFEEYLRFHHIILDKNWQYGEERNSVVNFFQKYFYFGGFAEAFNFFDKRDYLNSLYNKILLGDIIVRNEIRNDKTLRLLMKKLAEVLMHPTSLTKLKNAIVFTGLSIAKNTLIDYLGYIKDSYLMFDISNFSDKFSERETIKKRYFSDNGLLNILLTDPNSRLLENAVK
jgi:predicted AAA+ superfamily ATPase